MIIWNESEKFLEKNPKYETFYQISGPIGQLVLYCMIICFFIWPIFSSDWFSHLEQFPLFFGISGLIDLIECVGLEAVIARVFFIFWGLIVVAYFSPKVKNMRLIDR